MKRVFLLLFVMLAVSAQLAYAQSRHVKGKVFDDKGQGLPSAGVAIKNTTTGTVTDVDGNFELDVPDGDNTLVVQAIGYATQEATIVGTAVVVNLKSNIKELHETVVTALGIKREKRTLSYATQNVGGEDMNKSGSGNALSELEGKVSGLSIINSSGDPGAGTYMQLRGITSLTGDNQPLIIIDGIPIDNSINNYDPTDAGFQASGSNGNLTGGTQSANRGLDINPSDIESISVMKGPAATALYGIRAASGALIITTKKGNSGGSKGVHVSLNSSISVDQENKLPDLQNTYSQGTGNNYLYPNKLSWGAAIDTLRWTGIKNRIDQHGDIVGKSDPTGKIPVTPYDPYKFFQNGMTYNNNVALSGGDDKSSYRMSLGNMHQSGIVPNTLYDKTSFSLNGQSALTEKLTVSAGLTYTNSFNNKPQQGSNLSGIMLGLLRTPATYDNSYGYSDAYNHPDAYVNADGTQRNYRGGGIYDNPYWTVNRNKSRDDVNRVFGYGQANYKLFDWMDITYRLGGDAYSQGAKSAYDLNSGAFTQGYIYLANYANQQFNSDFIVNMHKAFNKDLNGALTLGQNYFTQSNNTRFSSGTGFVIPDFLDISNATSIIASESESRLRRMAWYGQGNLDYKNMLYLTVTGRNETSSTLPASKNSFFYPSAGLSFIFTEALGLSGNKILPYGKLRVSYAQVGKDAPLQGLQTYYKTAALNDGFTTGLTWPYGGNVGWMTSNAVSVLGNPDLKPEKTNSFEAGTDLAFFQNRISLTATFYSSKTTDGIFTVPISYATGYASELMNAAQINNHGLELTLSTTPIKTKWGLRWDLNVNWSKNVNNVASLSNGLNQLFIAGFTSGGVYAIPGQPFGVIMGTDYVRDSKGNVIIDDNKTDKGYGMPVVGTKNVPLGNIQPDWIGSIVNNLSYKSFTLGFQIDMRQGGNMWNGTRGALSYFGRSAETMNRNDSTTFAGYYGHLDVAGNIVHNAGGAVVAGEGSKNTTVAKTGQYYWQNVGSSFIGPASQSIEDGSWVRLRQISLTYALPKSFISRAHFSALSVTVFMNNVILFTKYKGVDPETSLAGPANGQGLDYFNNPGIKSYGARLNVGL